MGIDLLNCDNCQKESTFKVNDLNTTFSSADAIMVKVYWAFLVNFGIIHWIKHFLNLFKNYFKSFIITFLFFFFVACQSVETNEMFNVSP